MKGYCNDSRRTGKKMQAQISSCAEMKRGEEMAVFLEIK
jgi:hypothetical protein